MKRQDNNNSGDDDNSKGLGWKSEDRDARTARPMNERLLLRPSEAAELLATSPRKLWDLTNRGEVPHLRIGRSLRYPLEGLLAWIDRQQRGRP